MLESTLRDRATALLTPSARSDVPPFMVMDVMAAAARIEAAGGHVIHLEVGRPAARHGWTGEALLPAHRKAPLRGVLVGSPANPTGTMMSREALTGLISAAEGAGIRFISDEIYHGLDYAFPAVTAAELSPHALVINSFSKYFCMTGWRVGWMVVPEPLVRPVERLQQNLAISVPTLSQIGPQGAVHRQNA